MSKYGGLIHLTLQLRLTILPVFPVAPFFFHGAWQSSLIDAEPSPLLNLFKKTPPTLHSSRDQFTIFLRLMKPSCRKKHIKLDKLNCYKLAQVHRQARRRAERFGT